MAKVTKRLARHFLRKYRKKRPTCKANRAALILLIILNVLDDIANGLDVLNLILGNLNAELVLDSHYQVNNVQRVRAKIVRDRGRFLNVSLLNVKLLGNQLFNLL